MEPLVFRNSIRHLRGVWSTRLFPTVLMVIFLEKISADLPWYWFEIIVVIAAGLTLTAFLEPLWDAKFRTLTVLGDEVSLRTGWLAPETRSTLLSRITSVQVDEPLSQRLADVRSVTITASGAINTTFKMPALTPAASDQLCALISAARPHICRHGSIESKPNANDAQDLKAVPGIVSTDPLASDGAHVSSVYEASVRDIVATAFASGYPLAVAAGVVAVAQDVSEVTGASFLSFSWSDPRIWVLAVVGILAIFAGATVLKYWRFKISRTLLGEFVISYGALKRTSHTIAAGEVVAISLIRTPVDVLFGTTRLKLITAQLGEGGKESLVFPSIATEATSTVVSEIMGRTIRPLYAKRHLWLLTGPLLIVGITVAVALSVGMQNLVMGALAAFVALLVISFLARYFQGRITIDDQTGDIIWSDVGLAYSLTAYSRDCIRLVIDRRLPGLPVGNLTIVGWAHGRVGHRCPVVGRTVYDAVVEGVRDQAVSHHDSNQVSAHQEAP